MRRTTASAVMEPVRVVLGASLSLAESVRRFAAHESVMAPVVGSGKTLGILSRSSVEHAVGMGAGGLTAAELICGGAPCVGRLSRTLQSWMRETGRGRRHQ